MHHQGIVIAPYGGATIDVLEVPPEAYTPNTTASAFRTSDELDLLLFHMHAKIGTPEVNYPELRKLCDTNKEVNACRKGKEALARVAGNVRQKLNAQAMWPARSAREICPSPELALES